MAILDGEGWTIDTCYTVRRRLVSYQAMCRSFSQLDNILAWFVENIRDGQNLVETFNLKPSWKCQVE
jgi:hypothetical protein